MTRPGRVPILAAVLVALACALLAIAPARADAAPPNDDFAAAAPLTDFPVRVEASDVGATEEPNEPWALLQPASEFHTVWWRWTAPVTAHVAVNVCATAGLRGALAAVYTGDSLLSLAQQGTTSELLGCPGPEQFGGRVAFFAQQGRAYMIAVNTWEAGPFLLEVVRAGTAAMDVVNRPDGPRARVIYRAAAGEVNQVALGLAWDPSSERLTQRPPLPSPPPVALLVNSAAAVSLGPGCLTRRVQGYLSADFGECVIPPGMQATGPIVRLGDRDDGARVLYSRAGTFVSGGPGDDSIEAGGDINGGPGDDQITARTLVASHISGGPGDDVIRGSKRRDTVTPGRGNDVIDLRGVSTRGGGGEGVDSRDGEIDWVRCYRKDSADIDALDEYPDRCGHVRRHGGPARAIPTDAPFGTGEFLDEREHIVDLSCPADGPRECSGTVTISKAGRIFVRERFRKRRYLPKFNEIVALGFIADRRKLRAMAGKVRVTVRSRDVAGKLRTAAAVFELRVS